MNVECIWPTAALLGEGPMWCPRSNMLWFTDIKGGRLHRFNPLTRHRSSFTVDGQPGFVLPADDGALVAAWQQRQASTTFNLI